MRKKMAFVSALLTLCLLAAGACAGGNEANVRYFATPEPAAMDMEQDLATQMNSSRSDVSLFTYGGSGNDALIDMAVSEDGRIVMTGYTDSNDGTLGSRTKTGRTGWALCVNSQGDVLWSFCSRQGVHDTMSHPVFHEDGSVTVLLEAEMGGTQEIEMISLSREGGVNWRRTLVQEDKLFLATLKWQSDRGYIIGRGMTDEGMAKETLRFRWDGARDEAFLPDTQAVQCTAGDYAVRLINQVGWFGRMDETGRFAPLSQVFIQGDDRMLYGNVTKLLALEDGAVGCGYLMTDPDGDQAQTGRITRWNALGQVVFDNVLDCGPLASIARIPGGYAATACAWDGEYGAPSLSLIVLNEQGNEVRRRALDGANQSTTCPVLALPDGYIAVLHTIEDSKGHTDAQLMRFKL